MLVRTSRFFAEMVTYYMNSYQTLKACNETVVDWHQNGSGMVIEHWSNVLKHHRNDQLNANCF